MNKSQFYPQKIPKQDHMSEKGFLKPIVVLPL